MLHRFSISLLLAAVTAVSGCGENNDRPRDVTRAYLQAVSHGDGAKACSLLAAGFRKITAEAAGINGITCEESVTRMARMGDAAARAELAKAQLADEGSGGAGSVWVRITSGPWRDQLVTLRKENGKWRIASQTAPQR